MNYTIKADPKEHWVSYRIYEVAGYMAEGKQIPLYGENYSENPEDGYLIATGDVKWDGCSNWELNPDCMLHGCSREDLVDVGKMLAECWDMTASLCPKWDQSIGTSRP